MSDDPQSWFQRAGYTNSQLADGEAYTPEHFIALSDTLFDDETWRKLWWEYQHTPHEVAPSGRPLAPPKIICALLRNQVRLYTEEHALVLAVVCKAIRDACCESRPHDMGSIKTYWENVREDAREFLMTERSDRMLQWLGVDSDWLRAVLRDHTKWGHDWKPGVYVPVFKKRGRKPGVPQPRPSKRAQLRLAA